MPTHKDPGWFSRINKWVLAVAAFVVALGILSTPSYALLSSDYPPEASIARVTALETRVAQSLQSQQQALEIIIKRLQSSERIQQSTAYTLFKKQLSDAEAAIDAAARKGERDPIAEQSKVSAEIAIREVLGMQPQQVNTIPPANP